MKKVILKEDLQTLRLEEIIDNSIVGIKWKDGEKCMLIYLTDVEGESGFGGVRLRESLKEPHKWVKDSKKDYVEESCKVRGAEAFVFKTYEELFNWLKVDCNG